MLVGELMARLGLDRTEFDKGLADAQAAGASRGQLIGGALKGAMVAGLAGLAVVVGAALKTAFDAASDNRQAINNLQASLGVTREEAERLSKEGQQLWTNGFGGNLVEANERISSVRQNIKGLADEDLAEVAAGNSAIAETFQEDAQRVDSAVNVLMTQMGLSYQEAQDFITAGFQRGLNASGDFLDSIGEYSVQFNDMGMDASQMFSLMETGLQGGALGTDKAADSMKEFRIRTLEFTDDVWGPDGALRMALDDDTISQLYQGLQDGSVSVADAYQTIMPALQNMDNEVYRNTLGVKLFGTQWEDMGPTAMMSIDLTKTSLDSLSGSTDGLNVKYDSLSAAGEGLWRRTQVALIPVGDAMLELANAVMPHVFAAFTWLETNVPPAIGAVERGFAIAIKAAQPVISQVQSVVAAFGRGGDASSQFSGILTFLGETWAKIAAVIKLAAELVLAIVVPIFRGIAQFLTDHSTEITTVLRATWTLIQTVINNTLAVITGLLKAALAIIRGDWQGAWDAIVEMLQTVWANIKTYLSAALDGLKALLSLAWDAIRGAASAAWNALWSSTIAPAWNTITGGIDGAIGEVKKKLDTAWSTIKSGAESAWKGIASGIASAFSSAVGGIKGVLNDMIGKVNEAIAGFNALPGPDLPKIPRLAKGTSFFAGGIALVGEEGPELVAMPRGTQVVPHRETRDLLAGSGGVTNVYYPNATFVGATVTQESLESSTAMLQMLGAAT